MKEFVNYDFESYKDEVKERWSDTDAYKEHIVKTKGYSKKDWNNLADGLNEILSEFAFCKNLGSEPDSSEAQALVKKLQKHISENYYSCTNEILAGLGQMYVLDTDLKTT